MIELKPDLVRLIVEIAGREFPAAPPLLIAAQVWVESKGDAGAVSPAGAIGLMQIMPSTVMRRFSPFQLFDPETNLQVGVRYLREQFEHFPEIPDFRDRLSFALAAYNGGRGWINAALAAAREACGEPRHLSAGPRPGVWQRWDVVGPYLFSVQDPSGRHPDANQIVSYVARVWSAFQQLVSAGTGR